MQGELEPIRAVQPAMRRTGLFEVEPGMSLPDAIRTVAKIAATEDLPVSFVFNRHPYTVTPQEAIDHLTADNIRDVLHILEGGIRSHQRAIEVLQAQIEQERALGVKLFGEQFLDTLK